MLLRELGEQYPLASRNSGRMVHTSLGTMLGGVKPRDARCSRCLTVSRRMVWRAPGDLSVAL